jgi:DNA mismatch repair protein MutL
MMRQRDMTTIRQLPPALVNKIAAGEVIERPASVVKELLENSVDAGATRIDVAIENGGCDLIRIVDDGCGIAAGELELAVASHATSKLADADDLFRIGTLGFRGEALASIAEVSRLVLRSRARDNGAGAELEVVGGERQRVVPCGCPAGTCIEVRNLFYNTPVRRKFLKSTPTEAGHVAEALTRVALANPNIHFTLRHNDRTVYELPAGDDVRPRIATLFGQELVESLIAVESRDGDVRLSGFVADPSQSRANNRMQYLFLNGRAIRDRALQHALGEAYRGLLLTGRYPIAVLSFEMPPDQVDVNVHPTKLEVRFQDGGRIYSQLLSTLRTKFLTTDLTARGRVGPPGAPPIDPFEPESAGDDSAARRAEVVAWAKGELAQAIAEARGGELAGDQSNGTATAGFNPAARGAVPPFAPYPDRPMFDYAAGPSERRPLELHTLDRSFPDLDAQIDQDDEEEPAGLAAALAELESPPAGDSAINGNGGENAAASSAPQPAWPAVIPSALQIHNRYLVTESVEGVVVIDQHALHERIIYEQLRAKVLAGALETQQLLVPEAVDLAPAEAAAVLDHADDLERLGIRVSAFGGGTILVSSYPAMITRLAPADTLRAVVEELLSGDKSPDRRDLLDDLLHMMSCKAAIKAGDPLTPQEIDALLAQRHLAQDSHHCPHGRPTALIFTREDLDRQFKRT